MPLFMAITFDQTTIKHSMYTQKTPFQYTERACVFFSVLKISLKNDMMQSGASLMDQRECFTCIYIIKNVVTYNYLVTFFSHTWQLI